MEDTTDLYGTPVPKPAPPRVPSTPREKKLDKETSRRFASYESLLIPLTEEEEAFRHSSWRQKRAKVFTALVGTHTGRNKLERFQCCGSNCVVEYSESKGKNRLRADYCRNRHCEPCSRARANVIASNLRERLGKKETHGERYRFITLPLKHSRETPLAAQIKRLYACFKKLRNTKEWKRSQKGGAYVLEVKWNEKTRLWHPHLHIMSDGYYLSKFDLSALWQKVTGDSFIVDIRAIDSGKDAAFYVAKYVGKGTNDAVWNELDIAQEWITASKGVRICGTYGSWRGWKLLKGSDDATDWVRVDSLKNVIARARSGEVHAQQLLLILRPPGSSDSGPLPKPSS